MRIPFWIPQTPAGYALAGSIGLAIVALIVYVVFDGRPMSDVQCLDAACFQSRNLEAATAAAAGLLVGTFVSTRLESRWLHRKNLNALQAALATEPDHFGRSTSDAVRLLDELASLFVPEKFGTFRLIASTPDEHDLHVRAIRSAFGKGEAMVLRLYLERAELAADLRLAQLAGLAGGPIVESVRRAVALLVVREYLSPSDFGRAWAPFANLFGVLPAAGSTSWANEYRPNRSEQPQTSRAQRMGEAWGRWRAGRR